MSEGCLPPGWWWERGVKGGGGGWWWMHTRSLNLEFEYDLEILRKWSEFLDKVHADRVITQCFKVSMKCYGFVDHVETELQYCAIYKRNKRARPETEASMSAFEPIVLLAIIQ